MMTKKIIEFNYKNNVQIDLKINSNLIKRLVRILRIIRMKNTNALLIGPS